MRFTASRCGNWRQSSDWGIFKILVWISHESSNNKAHCRRVGNISHIQKDPFRIAVRAKATRQPWSNREICANSQSNFHTFMRSRSFISLDWTHDRQQELASYWPKSIRLSGALSLRFGNLVNCLDDLMCLVQQLPTLDAHTVWTAESPIDAETGCLVIHTRCNSFRRFIQEFGWCLK